MSVADDSFSDEGSNGPLYGFYEVISPDGTREFVFIESPPTKIIAPEPITVPRPMSTVRFPTVGKNVYSNLGYHGLDYYSYNRMKPTAEKVYRSNPTAQTVQIFVQMFPQFYIEQAKELLQTVISVVSKKMYFGGTPIDGEVIELRDVSPTSFMVYISSSSIWQLIWCLHKRVLMDCDGFWYAKNFEEYKRMKEFCSEIRSMTHRERHERTQQFPCMPLVFEMGNSVCRSSIVAPFRNWLPFDKYEEKIGAPPPYNYDVFSKGVQRRRREYGY